MDTDILQKVPILYGITFFKYLLISGGLFLFFNIFFNKKFQKNKIQTNRSNKKSVFL